jgi:hypothetical protein
MPVVAAVKRRRQFSRRGYIRIAVQAVTELVWIFLVDARECEIGKPLRSVDVKTGGHSGRLSTRSVPGKKEKDSQNCGPHRVATLNEASAGLKPL